MKRQILKTLAALLALLALAAGCAKEPQAAAPAGAEAEVSFTVSSPEIMTRAIADGNTVDKVDCYVYDSSGSIVGGDETYPISQTVDMTGGKAEFKVRLVTGQTYSFLFWAYKDGKSHYELDEATGKVTVSYTGAVSNDESRDAFYAYRKDVKIAGAVSETVTLKRPFAQVNFGTTAADIAAAKAAGIEVAKSCVKLTGLANELNLKDGSVSGNVTAEFAAAPLPADTEVLTVKGADYRYVATNYVLVGAGQKSLSDVELKLYKENDANPVNTLKVPNAPLQGNYRTNIVGDLFTSQLIHSIVVGPDFDDPDNPVDLENINCTAALEALFANGGSARLAEDLTVTESITLSSGKTVALDLNGKTIDGTGCRALVVNGGDLTVTGNGKMVAANTTGDDNALINVYSGKLTVNEVYFEGANACIAVIDDGVADIKNATMKALDGGCCLLAAGGTINVSGLKFTCEGDDPDGPGACWAQNNGTINIYGGSFEAAPLNNVTHQAEVDQANYCLYDYNDATAYGYVRGTINVYGGTFKDFNPADNYSHHSFLADGYQATKIGDIYYVTKQGVTPAASQDSFDAATAVENANITLVPGTYTLPTTVANGVTIKGESGNEVIDCSATATVSAKDVTIANVIVKGNGASESKSSIAVNGVNTTVTGCTFTDGRQSTYGSDISVSNGSGSVTTVSGCDFRKSGFRGVMIWNTGEEVKIDNCLFDNTYPFNCDAGTGKITVTDSELNGWTSYTNGLELVSFTDCRFGKSTSGYAYLVPYSKTVVKNCTFSADFCVRPRGSDTFTIEFINCKYADGSTVTSAIMYTEPENRNVSWIIDGVTYNYE